MKMLKHIAMVGLTGALLAACSTVNLDMTKKTPLSGDAFQDALFKEYVSLANSEDMQGDSEATAYYNDRALMAAKGKDSGPQPMSERKIPASAVADTECPVRTRVPANPAEVTRAIWLRL